MICTLAELEPRIAETERNLADLCHCAATHGMLGVTAFRRDYLQLFIDLRETLAERSCARPKTQLSHALRKQRDAVQPRDETLPEKDWF